MAEEKSDKPYLEESAFEALEKDSQEFISLLKRDEALEQFRLEYEKLLAVMKKSRENEKHLMGKCRKLSAELVEKSSKVAVLTKLSKDDEETISSLKTELEKSWKMVDAAYEKEQKAKETINSLQKEIARLNNLMKERAGQEYNVEELLELQEEVTKERDELLSEVVKLRQSLAEVTEQQQEAEKAKNEAEQSVLQLQQDIQLRQNEELREARKKEKMEIELTNLLAEMDKKQDEIQNLQQQIERSKEEQLKMEVHLREQKNLNEKASKELEQLKMKNQKLMQENEQHSAMFDEVMKDVSQKTTQLKEREDEATQMRLEISKLNKTRDVIQNKLRAAEEQKVDAENEKGMLKNQISRLEKELESAKKQSEIDKRATDGLMRERDMLNQNLIKATNATQKQINLVKLHEQSKQNLEAEIQNYKIEAQKQRKIIYQLEKERDGFINETSELKEKVLHHMKDLEICQVQICDYEKEVQVQMIKLKQQQNICETLRAERSLYSKNLIEAKDEIADMKMKLKTSTRQLDQLKEELKDKDVALEKAHLDHQHSEEEKESLKAEVALMTRQALETKTFIENQEAEERKLLNIIAEADAERLKHTKEFDKVLSERHALATQLIRRNDEVALLYEKIKIQQAILNRGESEYRQRVEDIRILKLEIKKLRREKGILGKSAANVEELRFEVNHMQKELLKEQTRCKILEEELQKPLKVHRWRKLEASDPTTYELIQKVQRLQKRLISKTSEVIEKEFLLQEKEKLYVELRQVLARQPGPEATEQLQHYRHSLQDKTKQLKVLSSELNMYEAQSKEYKSEIERLNNELNNVKKKYLAQKRKEQQNKEKERSCPDMKRKLPPLRPDDEPHFNIGGFPLTRPLPKIAA
ncbi:cilia- and flagella-associated protein 58 [Chiroxiphia lanceolata]|uniref:cilia- and flagella-associated protein 58 n=1 Tax=Chiroxiphia lanceolata TaxID=296741 RepID=UPI0013CF1508|nr:cilia- and flagella-associated protein 58 [Chiroxiphia lanceolata]XP_032551332.1 cilia- and flagella-associated protein 58 [Chiroxiphia lanceolata]XP_032551333.1 cilia- and flagella-associated protein 58 [Chiroxiphia lanceolata]